MVIVALREGGSPCSKDCPFHEEDGVVPGINGPLKTHCRATMETVSVDCDVYNVRCIDKMEVSEEEWKAMQRAVRKKAIRQRKLYPEEHEEIHHIGENTRDKGKWNAEKSKSPSPALKGERKKKSTIKDN